MTISMVQFIREISGNLNFVMRAQSLSMLNDDGHLFSIFRFRSGFIRGKYQFGMAADLSFCGNDFDFTQSYGLFLQCQLF